MRALSSSRRLALASFGLIPAVALLAACGSSTSPRAQSTPDTIGISEANAVDLYASTAGGDTVYYSYNGLESGDYVEAQVYDSTSFNEYREIVQFALPALGGKGIVDSARFAAYACDIYSGTYQQVGSGPHTTGRVTGARRSVGAAQRVHSLKVGSDTAAIIIDHMDWGAEYTGSATYWGQSLATNIGVLMAGSDVTNGWKTTSVTAAVAADYAAHRTTSQFRLRYNDAGYPSIDSYVGFYGVACNDDLGIGGPMTLVIWSH